MVAPRLRSRSLRRVKVRTTKGVKIHYRKRNRGVEKCAICKKPLNGIPRLTNSKFARLNKSQKTVSRAYGGYLCARCLRKKILEEVISQ